MVSLFSGIFICASQDFRKRRFDQHRSQHRELETTLASHGNVRYIAASRRYQISSKFLLSFIYFIQSHYQCVPAYLLQTYFSVSYVPS